MISMGMSSKGTSDIYVHKSIQAVNQETYLKECINKRLLPFIAKYHSNDLAKAHYSNIVQQCLTEKNIPFVSHVDNPPHVPQARPIETVWTVLERKIYENNWEAKKILIIWLKESNKKQKNLTKKCCKAAERILGRSSELCSEMDYIQFFKYDFL